MFASKWTKRSPNSSQMSQEALERPPAKMPMLETARRLRGCGCGMTRPVQMLGCEGLACLLASGLSGTPLKKGGDFAEMSQLCRFIIC
jgi:hypothetical protein